MSWRVRRTEFEWPSSKNETDKLVSAIDRAISLLDRCLAFSKYQLALAAAALVFLMLNRDEFTNFIYSLGSDSTLAERWLVVQIPLFAIGIGGSLASILAIQHNISTADELKFYVASGQEDMFGGHNYLFGWSWWLYKLGDSAAKISIAQAVGHVAFLITLTDVLIWG